MSKIKRVFIVLEDGYPTRVFTRRSVATHFAENSLDGEVVTLDLERGSLESILAEHDEDAPADIEDPESEEQDEDGNPFQTMFARYLDPNRLNMPNPAPNFDQTSGSNRVQFQPVTPEQFMSGNRDDDTYSDMDRHIIGEQREDDAPPHTISVGAASEGKTLASDEDEPSILEVGQDFANQIIAMLTGSGIPAMSPMEDDDKDEDDEYEALVNDVTERVIENLQKRGLIDPGHGPNDTPLF